MLHFNVITIPTALDSLLVYRSFCVVVTVLATMQRESNASSDLLGHCSRERSPGRRNPCSEWREEQAEKLSGTLKISCARVIVVDKADLRAARGCAEKARA